MPDLNDLPPIAQAASRFRRVIADGNQPARLQEQDEFRKKLLADSAFVGVVRSIAEGISRLVGVQGEDVPQENRRLDSRESLPDDGSGLLINFLGPLVGRRIDSPQRSACS